VLGPVRPDAHIGCARFRQGLLTSTPAATSAFRAAAVAHGEHERRTGKADANWPDWYAEYMVAEQAGKPLPV